MTTMPSTATTTQDTPLPDHLAEAWNLIANADWDRDPEWTAAAERWRDEVWHPALTASRVLAPSPPQGRRFIFKFQLDPAGPTSHPIPEGSEFLALRVQRGLPVMWWSVPHRAGPPTDWPVLQFTVVPTGGAGYEPDDVGTYLGTFQLTDLPSERDTGEFVGHVFVT